MSRPPLYTPRGIAQGPVEATVPLLASGLGMTISGDIGQAGATVRLGTAGAIRGSNQDRNNQQRYRDNQGRYYYCYDGRQDECYWENGQRRY